MDTPTHNKISRVFDARRSQIVDRLNAGIRQYCGVLDQVAGVRARNPWIGGPLSREPFFGVAGGLLQSLVAVFEVDVRLGVDYFLEVCGVESQMRSADLVVTGEGTFDNSLQGKTPIGVTRLAKKAGKPAIVLCGAIRSELKKYFHSRVSDDLPAAFEENGIDAIVSCHLDYDGMELPEAYSERVKFFRERNPAIFADAMAEYVGERVHRSTSA